MVYVPGGPLMIKQLVSLVLVSLLCGCAVGPRRLRPDCTWEERGPTKTENIVGYSAVVGIVGGLATFVYGVSVRRSDIAGPGFAVASFSIPVGWWAAGAFEEVPVGRYAKCKREVWK